MKTKSIAYWSTTGLLALALIGSGAGDLTRAPQVVEGITHLGYPAYLATILGFWKLLGALALLAPKLPRVKEWAYAGIVFNMTGALASHAIMGDPLGRLLPPLLLLGLTAASWALRPHGRALVLDDHDHALAA